MKHLLVECSATNKCGWDALVLDSDFGFDEVGRVNLVSAQAGFAIIEEIPDKCPACGRWVRIYELPVGPNPEPTRLEP